MPAHRVSLFHRVRAFALVGAVVGALGAAGCATTAAPAPSSLAPSSPDAALEAFYASYDAPMSQMPAGPALDPGAPLSRLAFGSCMEETEAAPILQSVIAAQPDAMVFLGDNVYGDMVGGDVRLPTLRAAYADMAANADFAALAQSTPLMATWDDHDYGLNDAGREFAARRHAERLFETFWRVPADDPRRGRDGVYASATFGPEDQRVQVILLDTRFFRTKLTETPERAPGRERYVPTEDPDAQLLGDDQWTWLAEELAKPAAVTVLVSSIQVIADGHGWEAWRLFPDEQARLYELIDTHAPGRVVIVSGDRHRAGLYETTLASGARLAELTTSSLNLPGSRWGGTEEAGPNRLGPTFLDENFGLLEFDWEAGQARASVQDLSGDTVMATVAVTFDAAPIASALLPRASK